MPIGLPGKGGGGGGGPPPGKGGGGGGGGGTGSSGRGGAGSLGRGGAKSVGGGGGTAWKLPRTEIGLKPEVDALDEDLNTVLNPASGLLIQRNKCSHQIIERNNSINECLLIVIDLLLSVKFIRFQKTAIEYIVHGRTVIFQFHY